MRFAGGKTGASPLILQLKAPSTRPGRVLKAFAGGENSSGSASRPVLFRPSSVGTASSTITPECVDTPGAGPLATCELAGTFSSSPTIPGVSIHASNLPIRTTWNFLPDQAFVLDVSGACLLYGYASGGHTWSGSIEWEEQ